MINPVQLKLTSTNGNKRPIIIEPLLEKTAAGLVSTGVYKIYKDAFGEESALFTEPLEFNEPGAGLPDDKNPDYIGKITFAVDFEWHYEGELLNQEDKPRQLLSSARICDTNSLFVIN